MAYGSLQQRLKPEPVRTLAFGSIPSSGANPAWVVLATSAGTTGLSNPSRILMIQNFTNAIINFSWDSSVDGTGGVSGNINLQLPSNGYIVLDETTNGTEDGAAFTATNTKFWVQYSNGAPTSGFVNVSTIYATGPII